MSAVPIISSLTGAPTLSDAMSVVPLISQGTSYGRSKMWAQGLQVYGQHRLPNDASGTCTLRLKNAISGSEYGIFVYGTNAEATLNGTPSGVGQITGGSPGDVISNFDIPLDYYPTGHANNTIRIRVRRGTSTPKYQPFETQALLQSGNVVSYIAQIPDSVA